MRRLLVVLHRWFGLGAAAFLFVAGITGAVISWDHEIDEWLNPRLFDARSGVPTQPVLAADEIVALVERADPRVRVNYLPLAAEPGHTLLVSVEPKVDASTGKVFEPGYNQVAVDPQTGEIQARRMWGEVALTRENLLPFLYKLHYSMHVPDGWGVELGVWLMGLVAIAWVLDTLVAFALSLPHPRQWRRSFAFRWRQGGHRLVFDLHRSGGMWLYALVLMLAVTSVAMNLREPVFRPAVEWFSKTSPSPFATRVPRPLADPIESTLTMREAIARASDEARRLGVAAPPGAAFVSVEYGVWGVGFHEAGHDHGDGGLGNPWIYVDSRSGTFAGADIPGRGSAGDLVMQSMFPLHSGRIVGLPGRILVSAMGVAVAVLSVTGVLVWARKRRARRAAARPAGGASPARIEPAAG